jgi:hypothetical protein
VGKESAALHLARVKLGLMPLHLKQWPHAGPMMVREGSGEQRQYHVVDGWQHLGTLEPDSDVGLDEIERLSLRARRADFDLDSNRILTRLLSDPRYHPMPLPSS